MIKPLALLLACAGPGLAAVPAPVPEEPDCRLESEAPKPGEKEKPVCRRQEQAGPDAGVEGVPEKREIGKNLKLPSAQGVSFDQGRHNPNLLVMGRFGSSDDGRPLAGGGVMFRLPLAQGSWGSVGVDLGLIAARISDAPRAGPSGEKREAEGVRSWTTREMVRGTMIAQPAGLHYRTPNLVSSLPDVSLEVGGRLGVGMSGPVERDTHETFTPDEPGASPRSGVTSELQDGWAGVVPSAFAAATVAVSKTFGLRGEAERLFLLGERGAWAYTLGVTIDW